MASRRELLVWHTGYGPKQGSKAKSIHLFVQGGGMILNTLTMGYLVTGISSRRLARVTQLPSVDCHLSFLAAFLYLLEYFQSAGLCNTNSTGLFLSYSRVWSDLGTFRSQYQPGSILLMFSGSTRYRQQRVGFFEMPELLVSPWQIHLYSIG